MRILPVQRACIDQTGQGEPIYERLHEEFKSKVEGIIFNLESKGILALDVRTGLEKQEFLLQNDSKFHRQIHSIKRIPTTGGNFRYDSERDEDGHADSFWAWALANHAVIGAVNARPDFYHKWKDQKSGKETNDRDGGIKPTRKKGKSYETIMREMERGKKR
jgi:phage FluMu gp28-like protein